LQALEGKDLKDIILNIGAGGGAAAAPAAGGAADASGAPAEAAKEEEKEEGTFTNTFEVRMAKLIRNREGRVRRRYGIRTFRLSIFTHALRVFLHQLPVGSASSCISPQWERGRDGFKNGRAGLRYVSGGDIAYK
jgi:60s Acidic ribosomal protein